MKNLAGTDTGSKKITPSFLREGGVCSAANCKPGSVSRRLKGAISIINLGPSLLTSSINLPILTILPNSYRDEYGNEPFRFQDLFGFSTPEVYRDPGRPGKP
jgi:hypothetical protein